MPCGVGRGYPIGAGLVDGGVDQGPVPGKGWGGGVEQISQRVSYSCCFYVYKKRKMAFFEGCPVGWGGGTHQSWPGGGGGKRRGQGRVGGGAKAWGGSKGFGSGGVGGRGTGTKDGANFATCVVFLLLTKRRKMAFFEGCLVGWGGVPTGAGLVDGGVDQGP